MIGRIEQNTSVQVWKAEQAVSAEVLGIPIESPVLRIERLYLDQRERPIEWAVSNYGREQYKYGIDLAPRPNSDGPPRRKGTQ